MLTFAGVENPKEYFHWDELAWRIGLDWAARVCVQLETFAEPEVALICTVVGICGRCLWEAFDVRGHVCYDKVRYGGTAGCEGGGPSDPGSRTGDYSMSGD